ncbi:hypothetical protein, conserved [Trypanosoma brucei gambiense DAL972]|uniref:Centrosomal protein CEP104 N-terminal domain-containing protein n=2 Tax=Trypanosoma brucei TaxID=5691 RepID=C9ZPU7_TRYB9|nr:hypothetical protein, conserved [Trypanosoma brucei gambiense DAL972]RHW72592.1 hypothetical protein DPX39_050048000 [Trypanosoma brucei equiperdum]CBH11425.1 hypothetical protein, conserved [Trypanosoma brucei gambiense DAL972]|eukprot:XP_011773712.1 hypothetical protein, conserved [Trypanosoma brucei gambiense DAL972]
MVGLIPYDIVYRSSEDNEFPITGLGNGLATSSENVECFSTTNPSNHAVAEQHCSGKGWQSARFASMPQELVLRFPGNAELVNLRILSHESKIMSKMEVRLYALDDGDEVNGVGGHHGLEAPSFREVRFLKLGSVNFSSNEHTNYRSKERKTVHLHAKAYFLKLLFHAPHQNAFNRFKQIGVYSIECSGQISKRIPRHVDHAVVSSCIVSQTPVERDHTRESSNYNGSGVKLPPLQLEQQQYQLQHLLQEQDRQGEGERSPVETPVRNIITQDEGMPAFRSVRILEFEDFFVRRSAELLMLKNQAISMDDFDTAKACQDRIKLMNRRSKRIYQAEQDKVQAIIDEDFDAAKEAKQQMDTMIEKVYNDVQVPQLRQVPDPLEYSSDTFSEDAPQDGRRSGAEAIGLSIGCSGDRYGMCGERNEKMCWSAERQKLAPEGEYQDLPSGPTGDSGMSPFDGAGSDLGPSIFDDFDKDTDQKLDAQNIWHQKGQEIADAKCNNDDWNAQERPPGANQDVSVSDGTDEYAIGGRLQPWEEGVVREIMEASGEADMPKLPDVGGRKFSEMQNLNNVVGLFTTACLYSSNFKLRESALSVLASKMTTLYESSPVSIEEGVLRYLDLSGYGLQDHIPAVANAACAFVRSVLEDEANVFEEVMCPVVNLLPRLLCCAADYNPRLREEAMSTLALFVRKPEIGKGVILSAVLADPVDKDRRRLSHTHARTQLARLSVLKDLAANGGLQVRGSAGSMGKHNENAWSRLLQPCLNHQSSEVRDLAVSTASYLISEEKLVLTKKRAGEIDNVSIRDQLKAAAELLRAQRDGEAPSSPNSAAAFTPFSMRQRTPNVKPEKALGKKCRKAPKAQERQV